jgi:hypothetical protein
LRTLQDNFEEDIDFCSTIKWSKTGCGGHQEGEDFCLSKLISKAGRGGKGLFVLNYLKNIAWGTVQGLAKALDDFKAYWFSLGEFGNGNC